MTHLPKGAQWVAHDGKRARIRRLKQATRNLVVPPEYRARLDVLPIAGDTSDLRQFRMSVLKSAVDLAAQTGVDFLDVLDNTLTKLEAMARPQVTAAVPMQGEANV